MFDVTNVWSICVFCILSKKQKTGNALRALGRMAMLSANKRSPSLSPTSTRSLSEVTRTESLDSEDHPDHEDVVTKIDKHLVSVDETTKEDEDTKVEYKANGKHDLKMDNEDKIEDSKHNVEGDIEDESKDVVSTKEQVKEDFEKDICEVSPHDSDDDYVRLSKKSSEDYNDQEDEEVEEGVEEEKKFSKKTESISDVSDDNDDDNKIDSIGDKSINNEKQRTISFKFAKKDSEESISSCENVTIGKLDSYKVVSQKHKTAEKLIDDHKSDDIPKPIDNNSSKVIRTHNDICSLSEKAHDTKETSRNSQAHQSNTFALTSRRSYEEPINNGKSEIKGLCDEETNKLTSFKSNKDIAFERDTSRRSFHKFKTQFEGLSCFCDYCCCCCY